VVRVRYGFVVAGYVLMPEHVHLLAGEPRRSSLPVALQVLKQQTSRKLKQRGAVQFWQRRYYDFNVWSEEKRVEKLCYMHRNPVRLSGGFGSSGLKGNGEIPGQQFGDAADGMGGDLGQDRAQIELRIEAAELGRADPAARR
jgi:hypothetical protein